MLEDNCFISLFLPPFFLQSSLLYRSAGFQSFVKMALIKNPRKRPSAETLLQVSFPSIVLYTILLGMVRCGICGTCGTCAV